LEKQFIRENFGDSQVAGNCSKTAGCFIWGAQGNNAIVNVMM
jgi:hypothetical protein